MKSLKKLTSLLQLSNTWQVGEMIGGPFEDCEPEVDFCWLKLGVDFGIKIYILDSPPTHQQSKNEFLHFD